MDKEQFTVNVRLLQSEQNMQNERNLIMKKMISFALVLSLLLSFFMVNAVAAPTGKDTINERLKAITLKVKETLGIGDYFTDYSGTVSEEGGVSIWSLNWTSEDQQIYVQANENGRVIGYTNYKSDGNQYIPGNLPRFPSLTDTEALSIANAFLAKVLDTKIESVELEKSSFYRSLYSSDYYLGGVLKLNGVKSPVYVSLDVNAQTKEVSSYWRNDNGQHYGTLGAPGAAVASTAAAKTLKDTLNMRLTYALRDTDSREARLQYTPGSAAYYVVDALTGKLVNISGLDYGGDKGGYGVAAETADAASPSAGITDIEQDAINDMEGVMSQSALEAAVRAYAALGLTSAFELNNVSYSYAYANGMETSDVYAYLSFNGSYDGKVTEYKNVAVDAKTGALKSVDSWRYSEEEEAAVFSAAQAQDKAKSFAALILPTQAAQTILPDGSTASYEDGHYFVFNRAHDGIAFPENYISVGVDAVTGYISNFNYNWYDFEVTFASQTGIIKAADASDKYFDGIGVELSYVSVPEDMQPNGLLLAYTQAESTVWGVDALTGEVLNYETTEDYGLAYDDIAGIPEESMIKKLAEYGVGFDGDSFKPYEKLTQLDALVLIESADGGYIPLDYAANNDYIYDTAYRMGIIAPEEKDPNKLLTRAECVKYVVNALGYVEVAKIPGIYTAGFQDDSKIPAELVGYVAIGKGLGIIHGNERGYFNPNSTATRVQAAVMLYNCMSR
jgi:hypothetical protein